MEFWNNIINTALLGTDRRMLKQEDLTDDLTEVIELVSQQPVDKEQQFLNIASAAVNYRRCGIQPINKHLIVSKAEDEEKVYCSSFAHQVLNDIISVESFPLLKLWSELCVEKNFIVKPELVPVLLELGLKYKQLQQSLATVTGNRGKWLMQFNEAWKSSPVENGDEVWQTGTADQRKTYLKKIRAIDPPKARELLQQSWSTEPANSKTDLLQTFEVNVNDEDVTWLEQLLNEKNQKVKDEALRLLKLSPASSIVKKYEEVLANSVHVSKEKGMLGLGTKTILKIKLAGEIDKTIYKSGIQKITSEKNVSDEDFILFQLISAVPPSFFEQQLQLGKDEILKLFSHTGEHKQFISALGVAAIQFKDVDWLRSVLSILPDQFYPGAFELLPSDEKEKYALHFLDKAENGHVVLDQLKHFTGEWSMNFTRELFRFTVKNQYSYNRSFYNQHILSIPLQIIPELDSFAPPEDHLKNMWSKTSEYITQLLKVKSQIQQAFQP